MAMRLQAVRAYARLYAVVKYRLNLNLKGLGWMLRRVRADAVVDFQGRKLFVDHRIASSYDLLIAGLPNEIETSRLLREVCDPTVTVVDVGANVGELVLQAAGQSRRVIAFEPHPVAAAALRRSIELNGFTHVEVVESLVGDGASYAFDIDPRNANASAARTGGTVPSVRLDDRLARIEAPLILIIDVEGAEPAVLRGAQITTTQLRPLIIFEYNDVSRRSYTMRDIEALLGDGYDIYRLRRDGRLDKSFEMAWNCVAIPRGSAFQQKLAGHVV